MGKKLDQAIAEADEIEAADRVAGDVIPAHVKVSRPNRPRSKVLQVRLDPDEFAAIEQLAAARGLPPSTLARAQLLALLDTPAADPLQKLMQAAREFAVGA